MTIKIRGKPVDVDIRAELERFHFVQPRWAADKLLAASPFRYDSTPSWFVSLEHGGWHDSGAIDDNFRSGNFVSLIAFLDGITYDEAADYLTAMYGGGAENISSADDSISLNMPNILINPRRLRLTLDERILEPYRWRHVYLTNRGISEGIQRLYGVGYDRKRQAITLPWRYADGKLAAVKFRSTYSRVFWYEKGGAPISSLVYGIDTVYARKIKRVGLVEGESDAMTLADAGLFTVATGGATNWNTIKRDIIIRSPAEEIVIFRDNDKAGSNWARRIIADLSAYVSVKVAVIPGRWKDVNAAAMGGYDVWKAAGRARRVWVMWAAIC